MNGEEYMKNNIILIVLGLILMNMSVFAKETEFTQYLYCEYNQELERLNKEILFISPCRKTIFLDKLGRNNLRSFLMSDVAESEFRILLAKKYNVRTNKDTENLHCSINRSSRQCRLSRKETIQEQRDAKEEEAETKREEDKEAIADGEVPYYQMTSYKLKKTPHIIKRGYALIVTEDF